MYNVYIKTVLLTELLVFVKWVHLYEIPDVTLQALDPRGLSISLPGKVNDKLKEAVSRP